LLHDLNAAKSEPTTAKVIQRHLILHFL
jgi:hypothetical protein